MRIFLVIPGYNEAAHIGNVLKGALKCGLPVVFVDDGSSDKTQKVVKSFKKVVYARHKINLGKGAAIKTGAEIAFKKGAEGVIFMDSDGQHKPSDIGKFVEKLGEGYDVVLGTRNYSSGVPLVRYLGNKLASILVSILFRIYVSDLICGFRATTRNAFNKMELESADYAVETEMVIKIKKKGLSYCEVPVETVYNDTAKGVTILDAVNIFFEVVRWRLTR